MSKVKTLETQAMHQLKLATEHLQLAKESLQKASNSVDDFPTARHELSDLANDVAKILKDSENAIGQLNIIKTK